MSRFGRGYPIRAKYLRPTQVTSGFVDLATERESFDSGTNGNTIAATDLIFDAGADAGSATFTYSNAQSVNGTLSGKFTIPGGSTIYRRFNISGTNQTLSHFCQYMYVPFLDVVGANVHVVRALRVAGTVSARLSMNSTQTLNMQDGTTGVGAGIDFDDNALYDQWIRVEWKLDFANSLQTLRVFKGANLHGTTPDHSDTGAYTDATGVGLFELGSVGTTTNAFDYYVDAVGWRLADWVGPVMESAGGGSTSSVRPMVSIF